MLDAVCKKPRSFLSRHMAAPHKRMAKMLGYCLTLGAADVWSGFAKVAAVRLTEEERAALAFASLRSLPPRYAELTARAAFGAAGEPVPAFLNEMQTARAWADRATTTELKCYAFAAYQALGHVDQAAFYRLISEVEIAA